MAQRTQHTPLVTLDSGVVIAVRFAVNDDAPVRQVDDPVVDDTYLCVDPGFDGEVTTQAGAGHLK